MRFLSALVLLGVLGGYTFSAGDEAATRLVVDPPSFDFGRVRPSQRVSKEFRLRNAGDSALRIDSVSSTCSCAVAPLADDARSLEPGASVPLRVTLTTTAEPGPMAQTVDVRVGDPKGPVTQIRLLATVVGKKR